MKPQDELRAIAQLKAARRDLERLDDLLLDVLARDDQDSRPLRAFANSPHDPVALRAKTVLVGIDRAADAAVRALNAARWLADQPKPGEPEPKVCDACGEQCDTLWDDLCPPCSSSKSRFMARRPGTSRADFIVWRRERRLKLVVDNDRQVQQPGTTGRKP